MKNAVLEPAKREKQRERQNAVRIKTETAKPENEEGSSLKSEMVSEVRLKAYMEQKSGTDSRGDSNNQEAEYISQTPETGHDNLNEDSPEKLQSAPDITVGGNNGFISETGIGEETGDAVSDSLVSGQAETFHAETLDVANPETDRRQKKLEEIKSLEIELSNTKGLFAGFKRKHLRAKINELKQEV